MGSHNETQILRAAASAMEEWITQLPPSSPWRSAFEVIQRDVASSVEGEFLDWCARRAAWECLSRHERDRLTHEAIGEDRLTLAEIAARIEEQFGDAAISRSHVRSVVCRLLRAGEVQRIAVPPDEPGERAGVRWRYSRRAALSGPIADLEQAFHDADEGKASR